MPDSYSNPKPASTSPFTELGVTGLRQFGGYVREEYHKDLIGEKGKRIYEEMARDEPTVRALLFAIEKLIENVEWTVKSCDDDETPQEQIDFVEECRDDMEISFGDTVTDALSMCTYGFSILEPSFKRRGGRTKDPKTRSKFDDGKIGWRRWGVRKQRTLYRWDFEPGTDELRGVWQRPWHYYANAGSGSLIYIPRDRFLHFKTTTGGGDPEGLSLLRGAYRPWFFKKRLEEFEAIGVERDLAGIPMIKAPSQIFTSTNPAESALYADLQDLVKRVRNDEHAGIVLPSDTYPNADGSPSALPLYSFELVAGGGTRRIDPSVPIDRKTREILMCVLADFIMVGHEKAGSFSMHSDKTALFAVAINSFMQKIATPINEEAVPALLELNGMPTDHPPQFSPGEIMNDDITMLMAGIKEMGGLGWETLDLQNEIRRRADLPLLDQEELDASMAAGQMQRDALAEQAGHATDGAALDNQGKEIGNDGAKIDNQGKELAVDGADIANRQAAQDLKNGPKKAPPK